MDITITEELAQYWCNASFADIPVDVTAKIKLLLLDNIGVTLAGSQSEFARQAQAGAALYSSASGGEALVLGVGTRVPGPLAAFLNGIAAHVFELDDYGGCGHSGSVVFPALFGAAGCRTISGRDAIIAIAAGYDVAGRILEGAGGYYPNDTAGWHTTGTCGSFGAAATAARALGLNTQQFVSALGIAGSFTGGTWAFLEDGCPTKSLHSGRAAENGLSAALMAKAGMPGPRSVLEAPWGGFFSVYSSGFQQPSAALVELGSKMLVHKSGFKLHSCCRGLHVYLDALFLILGQQRIELDEIDAVVVHGTDYFKRKFDRLSVRSPAEAQFSIQYVLASALVRGQVAIADFYPLQTDHPRFACMMRLVEIRDRSADAASGGCPPIEIKMRDGSSHIGRVEHVKGSAEHPYAPEQIKDKFIDLSRAVIGADECAKLVDAIEQLETLQDLTSLLYLASMKKPFAPIANLA